MWYKFVCLFFSICARNLDTFRSKFICFMAMLPEEGAGSHVLTLTCLEWVGGEGGGEENR